MLTEICLYLKNWFDWNQPKFFGDFIIKDGVLTSRNDGDMDIQNNQYFRIIGSVFNDGVYKHGEETLVDEEFNGAVWLMALPPDFLALCKDISDWQALYGGTSSVNMSPYQSESFGGYSYSKSSGGGGSSASSAVPTWKSIFADRLVRYKKI